MVWGARGATDMRSLWIAVKMVDTNQGPFLCAKQMTTVIPKRKMSVLSSRTTSRVAQTTQTKFIYGLEVNHVFNFFSNSLVGATVASDSESAVYTLFSERYRVKRVRRGMNSLSGSSVYYVTLTDNSVLKVHLAKKSSLFGGEELAVSYISES